MIIRTGHLERLEQLFANQPVVAILGARQVGKTTLARQYCDRYPGPIERFDLEDPDDLSRLAEPKLALRGRGGLIVLDEIQRRPDLFPILRVLVDEPGERTRFLILGSAAPELLRQSSESLAGRIAYHELGGFSLDEVQDDPDEIWLRGGFPRSLLAPTLQSSVDWRISFIRTFLERDVPQLGIRIPSPTLHRFWRMLAHYHGQVWNSSELARGLGVTGSTIRRYLDVLTGALVVRQIQPWHENLGKRQVKSPKIYVMDSGLLHSLLGIESFHDLDGHPKVGASWEGFVIHDLVRRLGARFDECFFWATHAGAKLDLMVVRGRIRRGFEIKRTTAPTSTRSMHSAREALRLDRVEVIHAGDRSFRITEGIEAISFQRLGEDLSPMVPQEFPR